MAYGVPSEVDAADTAAAIRCELEWQQIEVLASDGDIAVLVGDGVENRIAEREDRPTRTIHPLILAFALDVKAAWPSALSQAQNLTDVMGEFLGAAKRRAFGAQETVARKDELGLARFAGARVRVAVDAELLRGGSLLALRRWSLAAGKTFLTTFERGAKGLGRRTFTGGVVRLRQEILQLIRLHRAIAVQPARIRFVSHGASTHAFGFRAVARIYYSTGSASKRDSSCLSFRLPVRTRPLPNYVG